MRTSVKHSEHPYLHGADVAMQAHQVTGKRPEGQVSNHTITGPKAVPSFWQREAYLR